MNILLISGSAEPGKDGVGDYCRELSDQLSKLNHKIFRVAWNDAFIEEITEADDALRFPPKLSEKEKGQRAVEFTKRNPIDCISLQWVAYSYQTKGLPLAFSRELKRLAKWVPLRHLMVHEIWIGVEPDSPLKHKVIGKIQRLILAKAVRSWQPQVCHTQAPFYQEHLRKLGIEAKLLPLFGNIPIAKMDSKQTDDPKVLSAILFGSIPEDADFGPFFKTLDQQAEKAGCQITIKCIGRNGNAYEAFAKEVQKHNNLSISKSGYLSEKMISHELQSAHFGLGLARPHLLCKSGAVAAFNDHGLPILSTREGIVPEIIRSGNYLEVPLIELHELDHTSLRDLKRTIPKAKSPSIARSMVNDLTSV